MKSASREKSREPDGAAPLPPKTNPANAGCPKRERSFEWEGEAPSEPWMENRPSYSTEAGRTFAFFHST